MDGSELDARVPDRAIAAALRDTDWDQLSRKLAAYAAWKARRMGLSCDRESTIGGGTSPVDVAQKAIEKFIASDRNWDPSKRSLEEFLRDSVDSIVSHHVESCDIQTRGDWPEDENGSEIVDGVEFHARTRDTMSVLSSPTPTPHGAVLGPDFAQARVTAIMEAVADSEELTAVIDALIGGATPTPQDVADALGISVRETNNRLRQLRGRADGLAAKPRRLPGSSHGPRATQ